MGKPSIRKFGVLSVFREADALVQSGDYEWRCFIQSQYPALGRRIIIDKASSSRILYHANGERDKLDDSPSNFMMHVGVIAKKNLQTLRDMTLFEEMVRLFDSHERWESDGNLEIMETFLETLLERIEANPIEERTEFLELQKKLEKFYLPVIGLTAFERWVGMFIETKERIALKHSNERK